MTMVKSYGANTYKNYGTDVKEPWALPAARSAWMDVGHSSMRWNATNDQFYRHKRQIIRQGAVSAMCPAALPVAHLSVSAQAFLHSCSQSHSQTLL